LRHRRVSRLLSALVLVAGWAVPLALPHYADDDPICVRAQTGKDDSGRFEEPKAASQPNHCAICHSARSFRSAVHTADRGGVQLAAIDGVVSPIRFPQRAPEFDRIPARAPPAV
jgi:hypothetical protein